LSFSTQRILRSDSRSCDMVGRSTFFILFSFENDLSPEQFVTIKHKNNIKIVSTLGKTARIFSCLIIWYNAKKFDSPDAKGGVGKEVKVSKLKFSDSRVGIGVIKFFCLFPSLELDCRSGIASPKILREPKIFLGDKMFDFRRITLFCLEKPLSKHKITIFSKHLVGACYLWRPPGYAYGLP